MTNETRNRIEAYKKALPEMKERVMAAAFLLVMSVMMITSATFAWLTISKNPEVSNVSTSVTANGNLEIALATSTTVPGESQVGDSSATENPQIEDKDPEVNEQIVYSNTKWGNLVNLSDSSYGLENLTLRPAQLNQSALLSSPLYGAVYQNDGRVEKLNSSFAYSKWSTEYEVFEVSNELGVRAISSTKVDMANSGPAAVRINERRDAVESTNLEAGSAYLTITQNDAWMNALATAMGTYMTVRLNSGQGDDSLTNPSMDPAVIENLAAMFDAFKEVYKLQFEALAQLANYQLYLQNGAPEIISYEEKTAENIRNSSEASLKEIEGIQISGLDQAKKDFNAIEEGCEKLNALVGTGTVKWVDSGLNGIVDKLVNVGKCTLDDELINNIGASNALGYLNKTCTAKITNGILYNFEMMNGAHCYVEKLKVKATIKRYGITQDGEIKANILTSVTDPKYTDPALIDTFVKDIATADATNPPGTLVEMAQDTFGLAVDLWVRTNASGSYLTLEGNVLTKSEKVRATGKDGSGNMVELWTLERSSTEDGTTSPVTYTVDLYQEVDEDGVITWYSASSHAAVTLQEGEVPLAKMENLITVVGYEGENRVWEDANTWDDEGNLNINTSLLPLDATTQGGGSCYVYYADSPEDQARSLKLLEAMNVAFVSESGELLATAAMDTEMYYAENGRVTVPLVLKSDSLNIGTNGKDLYAITSLLPNTPTRITAIVYLDGTKLSNQDVLAVSDIQGQLNIQFGSSVKLSHAEDESLRTATRSVSASIDNTIFDYEDSLGEDGEPMTTKVTVRVDGEQPGTMTAYFIRAISSTQGSREQPKMTFTKHEDGTWTAEHTFTAPGNYILRNVELDGQTYDLENPQTVTVEGFAIASLICEGADDKRHVTIMTDNASETVNLKLQFKTNDPNKMPKKVQGRFLRDSDGSAVNINFIYNSTTNIWNGQATFISSGDYTLEYLVLYVDDEKEGEYAHLDEGLIQTATVYLGMKTAVYTESPTRFKFIPDEMTDDQKNLSMKVKIMDNTGNVMEGLNGAHLYYLMEGSPNLYKGLSAPLTWNAASGYYEGTFPVYNPDMSEDSKIGVFKFSHVTVDDDTITYAETSPVFYVESPEPPGYKGFESNPYEYMETSDITMAVQLSYSSTATVYGLIQKLEPQANGEYKVVAEHEVLGTDPQDKGNNIQEWNFLIPVDAAGKQDGWWKLAEVYVMDCYDEEGNSVTEDDPFVFAVDGNITKAVNTLYITVSEIADADLGKDGSTVTGMFMDTHTISDLSVKIEDFEHQEIPSISNVTLEYVYGNNSLQYGGYTSTDNTLDNAKADFTVSLTKNGTTYTQTEAKTVKYAGTYTPNLKYYITGEIVGHTIDATNIAFAIYSEQPDVYIDSYAPTGTYNTVNSKNNNQNVTSKKEGNTVTVYPNSEVSSGWWPTGTLHAEAQVWLTLTGLGNADSATLAFKEENNGTVHMYSGSSSKSGKQTIAYTWDKATGETVKRFIGYNDEGNCRNSKWAGTLISDSNVTLVYGTESYNVPVNVITIINKQP